MAAPGTLLPADVPSTKHSSSKIPDPLSSNDTGVVLTTPNALPGSDAGVGSSGVANRAAPVNQLGNLSCTAIGTSVDKGSRGGHAAGDGVRMNVNVLPYGPDSPEDSRNLFSDLNPFQIKGTGKSSLHHKPAENKISEFPGWKNNPVPSAPAPLVWKNRYAYNEVPRRKENEHVEGFYPRINREPNNYNQSLASTSSSEKASPLLPVLPKKLLHRVSGHLVTLIHPIKKATPGIMQAVSVQHCHQVLVNATVFFLNYAKSLFDSLIQSGATMDDDKFISYVLDGLGLEYKELATTLHLYP